LGVDVEKNAVLIKIDRCGAHQIYNISHWGMDAGVEDCLERIPAFDRPDRAKALRTVCGYRISSVGLSRGGEQPREGLGGQRDHVTGKRDHPFRVAIGRPFEPRQDSGQRTAHRAGAVRKNRKGKPMRLDLCGAA
jgi:hypothetical protein